jgi:hypothetical protein
MLNWSKIKILKIKGNRKMSLGEETIIPPSIVEQPKISESPKIESTGQSGMTKSNSAHDLPDIDSDPEHAVRTKTEKGPSTMRKRPRSVIGSHSISRTRTSGTESDSKIISVDSLGYMSRLIAIEAQNDKKENSKNDNQTQKGTPLIEKFVPLSEFLDGVCIFPEKVIESPPASPPLTPPNSDPSDMLKFESNK